MISENLMEMIECTKNWKKGLESIAVKPEEEENKASFLKQMDDAIHKWERELANNSVSQE